MTNHWERGAWTNEPRSSHGSDGSLVVEAINGSDFWRRTLYGFVHDTGHALLAPLPSDRAVEVSFELAGLTELYDQAGVFVRAGTDRWIKAGVEISDGLPHLATVVTHGSSDWALAPVPAWTGVVTVRFSRLGDAAVIRARNEDEPWRTIRVAPLFEGDVLDAGPMVCAPTRSGLTVTFRGWRHTLPDEELHSSPPCGENGE